MCHGTPLEVAQVLCNIYSRIFPKLVDMDD